MLLSSCVTVDGHHEGFPVYRDNLASCSRLKNARGAQDGTANRQAVVHRQRYTVLLLAEQCAPDHVSVLGAGATSFIFWLPVRSFAAVSLHLSAVLQ